jgi:hypothetical protein
MEGQSGKKRRTRNYAEKLRVFTHFFTILRTEQGRIYAVLRIFTGETNFWPRMKHGSNTDGEEFVIFDWGDEEARRKGKQGDAGFKQALKS